MKRRPQHYLLPHEPVWDRRQDDAEPYLVARLAEIPEVVGDGATRAEAGAAPRACRAARVRYRQSESLTVPDPLPRAAAR